MKKVLLCFLCFCLLFCVSCAGGDEPSDETDSTAVPDDISTNDPEAEYLAQLPVRDYENADFKVLVTTAFANYFDAEEDTTDVVEKSTFMRNGIVEDRYGVMLKFKAMDGNMSGSAAFVTEVRASVDGNMPYDLVVAQSYYMMPLSTEGYLQDLYGSQYLNFDKEWYHSGINRSATINEHMYGASGDYVFSQIATVMGLLYNKTMYTALNYEEDIYQLVRDHEWTFEQLNAMVTDVYQDLDNNYYVSSGDRFGLTGPPQMATSLLSGMGNRLLNFDDDGLPTIEGYYGDRLLNSFDKVLTLYKNDGVTWDNANERSIDLLVQNQALFCCLTMHYLVTPEVRNCQYKIGIVPMPLYESGDEYLSAMQRWEMFFVPRGADFERASIVTEYLNYVSYTKVLPEYWDAALLLRGSEAVDDAEMMKLIRSTMYFDTAHIFKNYFPGFDDLAGSLINLNSNSLTSKWNTNKVNFEDGLDLLLEAYGVTKK